MQHLLDRITVSFKLRRTDADQAPSRRSLRDDESGSSFVPEIQALKHLRVQMIEFLLLAVAVLCLNLACISATFYIAVKLGFLPGIKWSFRTSQSKDHKQLDSSNPDPER